jgi:hypothetical protein
MKYPIYFPISLEEAQILEISLRGDIGQSLDIRRPMLKELGRILLDKTLGELTISEEADIWFLRDNIDPNAAVGDSSGLDLITRVYGIILGYKPNNLIVEVGDANENETSDSTNNEAKGRPSAEAKPRQALSGTEGTDCAGDINAKAEII